MENATHSLKEPIPGIIQYLVRRVVAAGALHFARSVGTAGLPFLSASQILNTLPAVWF